MIDRAIRTAREYLKAQPDAEHTAAWGHGEVAWCPECDDRRSFGGPR